MQQMMKLPLISAAAQPILSYKRGREKAWGTLWQTAPSWCWSWLKRLAALLITARLLKRRGVVIISGLLHRQRPLDRFCRSAPQH
jgi:hypothetical protein